MKTGRIENYYGFEYGIDGNELYNTGINQAKNIGVDVVLKGFCLWRLHRRITSNF